MRVRLAWILLVVLLLAGCRPKGPVPIDYGQDICAFCKMIIADPRYGAELITKKGKVYKFDSVECMVAYMIYDLKPDEVGAVYVTDFAHPRKLIPAESAYYLQSVGLRSPMSLGITAFASKTDLEAFKERFDGLELLWKDLPNVIRESGFSPGNVSKFIRPRNVP